MISIQIAGIQSEINAAADIAEQAVADHQDRAGIPYLFRNFLQPVVLIGSQDMHIAAAANTEFFIYA